MREQLHLITCVSLQLPLSLESKFDSKVKVTLKQQLTQYRYCISHFFVHMPHLIVSDQKISVNIRKYKTHFLNKNFIHSWKQLSKPTRPRVKKYLPPKFNYWLFHPCILEQQSIVSSN